MLESVHKKTVVFIYFALILSTLLVFWQVHDFDFINFDDDDYVYENPHVLNGLTQDGILWVFTSSSASNWHPLTWLSLMLDNQLFGMNAGWMHCVNLFLHLANTLLLFAVLKKMTAALWPSAFVAAAFALHPMHVESVVWITERKDVLSTLFLLLALAAYAAYVRRRGLLDYLLTLLLFALGLLAKPMLVTLPFLLLLLDYWPLGRLDLYQAFGASSGRDERRVLYHLVIEKIPFFVLSAVSSVITFFVQYRSGAVSDLNRFPLHIRAANIFSSYATYIGKLFWPENLAVFYPLEPDTFTFWRVAMCVLLLLVIFFFVIYFRSTQKYLPVGWLWFLGTLVPVIGLVQVGNQAYADRYTYIPYIGLLIMTAWGLPELLSKWPQRKIILGSSMVILLTSFGMGACLQVSYWNHSVSLFARSIEVTRNNHVAYTNLGAAYGSLGRYQEAIETLNQALKIRPDDTEVYNNLGTAYDRLGCLQEAIENFNHALKINPKFSKAYNNRGLTNVKLGRWQEAIEDFNEVIRIKPDYAKAYNNLGDVYRRIGRWQEAIEAYQQAVRIWPNYAESHTNLGIVYSGLGRQQEAIEALGHALRIKPDSAELHINLGLVYSRLGRRQEAMNAYQQAIQIKPDYAEAYYNLADELIMQGRRDEALDQYRAALGLKPDWPLLMNNLALLIAANPDIKNRDVNEAIHLASRTCELTNYKNPIFLGTLAASYAAAGRFSEAVDMANRALNLADAANQTQIKNIIEYHLSLYKQGRPYIEPPFKPLPDSVK